MKNEEAKRIAMGLRTDFKCESETMVDFCNTIIKALEQEPCEDVVSRQAVHNMLEDIPIVNTDKWFNWLQKACLRLADLPPVTPTCKTGKWTPGDPICPCCGEDKFKDLDADIWSDWQPKYCPNCGAKMEVEEYGINKNS